MPAWLIRWLILTVAVIIVPHLSSGVKVDGIGAALFAAAVLGILNAMVRPLLVLLTLPLTVVTLGVFILVINALLFELAAAISPGVHVESFWSALFASIIVSIVSWIANSMITGPQRGPSDDEQGPDGVVDMRRGKGGTWE